MSNKSNKGPSIIKSILGLGAFIGVVVLLVWVINPDLFKTKKKGETCTKKDGDTNGIYKYDKDGNCVLSGCKSGWKVDGSTCVKKQVVTISSAGPSAGPGPADPTVPTTAVISSPGQNKAVGVTYTCPTGQVSGCNVNNVGVGDANSVACPVGSYIYCYGIPTPGAITPGAIIPGAITPGTTGSGSYSTPAATTPPPPAGVEGFMDCAYGNPDSNYVCIAGASRAENCTWDDNECSGYYSDTCPPGVTLNDRGYCQV